VTVDHFVQGYGAGNGSPLDDADRPARPVLIPEVRFYTNDSWAVVRGVAAGAAKGYPLLLMNHYSKGTIYMLTVPENPGDLYNLPRAALNAIRSFVQPDGTRLADAPARVALFAYDNGAVVVESFRDEPVTARLEIPGGGSGLVEVPSGRALAASPLPPGAGDRGSTATARASYAIDLPPHSFRVFRRAGG
jgi:hypothetical protein